MLWRKMLPCVLVLAGLAPLTAMAADHIASIDYQKILKEAPQIKASEKSIKQEYTPRKKALDKQRKETSRLFGEYRNLDPGTNQLARASAAEKLKQARNKLRKMTKLYQSGVQLRETQLRENFKDTLEDEVSVYARFHGYTVVMKSGVAYAGPAVDITEKILGLLERDYHHARASDEKKGK
jgi:outer membrane protein